MNAESESRNHLNPTQARRLIEILEYQASRSPSQCLLDYQDRLLTVLVDLGLLITGGTVPLITNIVALAPNNEVVSDLADSLHPQSRCQHSVDGQLADVTKAPVQRAQSSARPHVASSSTASIDLKRGRRSSSSLADTIDMMKKLTKTIPLTLVDSPQKLRNISRAANDLRAGSEENLPERFRTPASGEDSSQALMTPPKLESPMFVPEDQIQDSHDPESDRPTRRHVWTVSVVDLAAFRSLLRLSIVIARPPLATVLLLLRIKILQVCSRTLTQAQGSQKSSMSTFSRDEPVRLVICRGPDSLCTRQVLTMLAATISSSSHQHLRTGDCIRSQLVVASARCYISRQGRRCVPDYQTILHQILCSSGLRSHTEL